MLALDRLEQERWPQLEAAERLLGVGGHGGGRVEPGARGLGGQVLLVAEPPRDVGVGRQRQLEALGELVPVAQDELDVVVALGQEQRPHGAVGERAQRREHGVVAGDDVDGVEVARANAELVRVHGDAGDRDAEPAEAAREAEPGPEQAEHDHRAVGHFRLGRSRLRCLGSRHRPGR